jgi:hypothetical protein
LLLGGLRRSRHQHSSKESTQVRASPGPLHACCKDPKERPAARLLALFHAYLGRNDDHCDVDDDDLDDDDLDDNIAGIIPTP